MTLLRNLPLSGCRRGIEGFEKVKTRLSSGHVAAKVKNVVLDLLNFCTYEDYELVRVPVFKVATMIKDILAVFDVGKSSLIMAFVDLELNRRVRSRADTEIFEIRIKQKSA